MHLTDSAKKIVSTKFFLRLRYVSQTNPLVHARFRTIPYYCVYDNSILTYQLAFALGQKLLQRGDITIGQYHTYWMALCCMTSSSPAWNVVADHFFKEDEVSVFRKGKHTELGEIVFEQEFLGQSQRKQFQVRVSSVSFSKGRATWTRRLRILAEPPN